MKSLQNDFKIVLELARQNIIEDPHMTEEAAKQIRACDNIEAFANETIRIVGKTENQAQET
jgi:hypothetical protein